MALTKAESAYYVYLTERMDKGESKNIVIPTAAELITKLLLKKPIVRVLDVGCFNGAMLNQIRLNTPTELRQRVYFTGTEIDKSLIENGRKKYPELTFNKIDLDKTLPDLGQHDIVILSNVLHEIIPNPNNGIADVEKVIHTTLDSISSFMAVQGNLLILDGLRPDNDSEEIEICFTASEPYELYKLFADKYSAFKVQVTDLGGNVVQTRVKDLVAFLTKARYLFEDYWPIESQQIYQYFDTQQFNKALGLSGFTVERFDPQKFTQEHLNSMFTSTNPKIEYPAKNVLIVATKSN